MINSPLSLIEEINNRKIIEGLSDRELTNPEGVGFDLCVSAIAKLGSGSGSVGVEKRRTPDSRDIDIQDDQIFVLEPAQVYLATTVEIFNLPDSYASIFFPRSTLFRSGILFQSSVCPPGYKGPLTFSLINMHSENFHIQRNARFAHALIFSVGGAVDKYRGQWQGGRRSQQDDEEQV